MNWTDDGIVLSARKHGESAAIVQLLTSANGRHAGLVRGGAGRRKRGLYQPGNRVVATWRARLSEHLGSYTCESAGGSATAVVLDDPRRLAALAAACAMAETTLPEREPHPAVYGGFAALLDTLAASAGEDLVGEDLVGESGAGEGGAGEGGAGEGGAGEGGAWESWARDYVRWELALLAELGFGLDLSACAATGVNDELVWVSPKSGRAVSSSAGEPWQDKLLPLPGYLIGGSDGSAATAEIAQGLTLTGHFLERHVFAPHGRRLPAARRRFAGYFPAP